MQEETFETKEEWFVARNGKITGSTSKDIINTGGPTKDMICAFLEKGGVEFKKAAKKEELETLLTVKDLVGLTYQLPKKMGFFRLIAERLALPPDDENAMERGSRLEAEMMDKFEEQTGKKLNRALRIWSREDESNIAVSPDASVIGEDAAVEGKALGSAKQIMAWYYKQVPDEYWWQVLQYFIVNDLLEKLYFVLYDPRIPSIELVIIEVTRDEVQAEVTAYLEYQRNVIAEVKEIVNKLTF